MFIDLTTLFSDNAEFATQICHFSNQCRFTICILKWKQIFYDNKHLSRFIVLLNEIYTETTDLFIKLCQLCRWRYQHSILISKKVIKICCENNPTLRAPNDVTPCVLRKHWTVFNFNYRSSEFITKSMFRLSRLIFMISDAVVILNLLL